MSAWQRLFGAVVAQFGRPHGLAGWLAGWEMALRPSNRKRNRWAVALLDVQPQDEILEIGFGPGLAIRELARRATDGFVLGIDHSEVMVRQAAVRNRAAVEQGRVDLRLGSALDLRDFSEMFDKALAVNNFGMWPEPGARLKDLRGALRPGGRVAIVSQPRCLGATAETTERVGEETAGRLRDAGFISLHRETLNLRPPVACVLAEAPLSERGVVLVSTTTSSSSTARPKMDRSTPRLRPRRLIAMAVPLLALGAIARLAILDDAEASTYLLSHLDTWAWAVGILLILADLVLPVPQASVITALGAIYGIALEP